MTMDASLAPLGRCRYSSSVFISVNVFKLSISEYNINPANKYCNSVTKVV